jgi:transcriptional regulator with XRE-family HTH domain
MITTAIRAARERLGIKQVDLARTLGVKRSTLCGWEHGRRNPRKQYIKPLSLALSVSAEQLILGVTNEPPAKE